MTTAPKIISTREIWSFIHSFFGRAVSAAGITPLPAKYEAVQQFPKSSTQHQLKEFLGMINYTDTFQSVLYFFTLYIP